MAQFLTMTKWRNNLLWTVKKAIPTACSVEKKKKNKKEKKHFTCVTACEAKYDHSWGKLWLKAAQSLDAAELSVVTEVVVADRR